MDLTVTEVKNRISSVFPRCQHMLMADSYYWIPRLSQLNNALQQNTVDREKYKYQSHDCDDFALFLHADIKRLCAGLENKAVAFGEVWCHMYRGRKANHAINICVCREGLYLVEPQTDEIWEASPANDDIYYCRV